MATVLQNPKSSDIEIWNCAVKGDTKAFEQVVISHQSAVSAVAFNIVGDFATSQDIAQETFWAAWKSKDSLRDAKRLGAWLCGIARNLARQWIRTKSRRKEVTSEKFGSEFDSYSNDPADDFVSQEEASVVWSALEKIPSNYREVLVLYYRQGQSIDQVAISLGISNDAARQRLVRGREVLRSRVSNLIEGVLDRTNPSRSFTSRVMAGIAGAGVIGSSSTAKASISMALNSSTVTSAATLGKVLSGGSMLGLVGGMIGAAGGMLGAWFGTWLPAQLAPTETERHLLTERGRSALRSCFIYMVIIFAMCFWKVAFPNAWASWLITFLIANAIFTVGLVIHTFRTQRLVTNLRNELSPEEDPNQSKIGTKVRNYTKSKPVMYGRRYTSKLTLLGFPLVDIQISDPERMDGKGNKSESAKARPAKGWIAIGDKATGLIAIGGFTFGGISIGGISCGVLSVGGVSAGIVSFGGLSLGLLLAIGGLAVGYEAIGGGAIAWHSATGGGAMAWHAAAGGGAYAHDFAVGGGAYANEANTELAQRVIDQECHMWAMKGAGWIQAMVIVGFSIAMSGVSVVASRFLYTTTPPDIAEKKN